MEALRGLTNGFGTGRLGNIPVSPQESGQPAQNGSNGRTFEPFATRRLTVTALEVKDVYFPIQHTVNQISIALQTITETGGATPSNPGYIVNSAIAKITMWFVDNKNHETKFLELAGNILREIQSFKIQETVPNNVWNWGFGRSNVSKMLNPKQFKSIHVQVEMASHADVFDDSVGGLGDMNNYTATLVATTHHIKKQGTATHFPILTERLKNFGTDSGELLIPDMIRTGNLDTLWLIIADGDIEDPTDWDYDMIKSVELVGDSLDYLLQDTPLSVLIAEALNTYKRTRVGVIPIRFDLQDLSKYSNLDLKFQVPVAATALKIKYIPEVVYPIGRAVR